MTAMKNKQTAALLREVADNIEKIGDASEKERKKTAAEIRRMLPIFEEHFVMSEKDFQKDFSEAISQEFRKMRKSRKNPSA